MVALVGKSTEIWLSTLDRKDILRLPYIADENVTYSNPLITETFENSKGKNLTLIGEEGLRTVKISSFFPYKRYYWLPFNVVLAQEALKYIKTHRKEVLKVTIVSFEITFVMECIIKDFDYKRRVNRNIAYEMTLEEYIDK
ncbi:hypothetical protein [Fusobacterium ulcerans]|uniref:hypothetical protein n=1 Tax=Fusobacterium ulcerans TaxID=861 RepID=UPI00056C6522|nr:hypothetical protein [Fusobacterium ulcerans]